MSQIPLNNTIVSVATLNSEELIAENKLLKKEIDDLLSQVEKNHRLMQRFSEIDLACRRLQDVFSPYEIERFDIKYTHVGIINGATRALEYIRHSANE